MLPLGVQQAPARRVLHARRQHPPLAPLGRRPLRPLDPARPRPPARDPHPRPRLVPRRLAVLARSTPMTRHATAACNSTSPSPSRPPRAPWSTSPPRSASPPSALRSQRTANPARQQEGDCRHYFLTLHPPPSPCGKQRPTKAPRQYMPAFPLTLTLSAARRLLGRPARAVLPPRRAAGRALILAVVRSAPSA